MNEFLLYIGTLKEIINRYYGKDTVFYTEGVWYSKYHSGEITQEQLAEWVLEITSPKEEE